MAVQGNKRKVVKLKQSPTLASGKRVLDIEADAIRFEKIKVLRTLAPIQREQVVRGQYTAGEIDGRPVVGYLEFHAPAENCRFRNCKHLNEPKWSTAYSLPIPPKSISMPTGISSTGAAQVALRQPTRCNTS